MITHVMLHGGENVWCGLLLPSFNPFLRTSNRGIMITHMLHGGGYVFVYLLVCLFHPYLFFNHGIAIIETDG